MIVLGGLTLFVYHWSNPKGRGEVKLSSLNSLFILVLLLQVDRADLSGNHVVSSVAQIFEQS